jgi:hypothetical protein
MEIEELSPESGALQGCSFQSSNGPLQFRTSVETHIPLFFSIAGQRSFALHASSVTFSEKTSELD